MADPVGENKMTEKEMTDKTFKTLRGFLEGDEPEVEIYFAYSATLRIFGEIPDLDEITRKQIERGQRVTEMLKQEQYKTLSVAEIAISLFAVDRSL